jgi:hypothetical protein
MRRRTWVVLSGVLLVTVAIPTLQHHDSHAGQNQDPGQASGNRDEPSRLEREWTKFKRAYAELRWLYVPGLRLSPDRKQALLDGVLEQVLLKDEWFGRPLPIVILNSDSVDGQYVPAIRGLSFEVLDGREIGRRTKTLDRYEAVRITVRDVYETPASLVVSVGRHRRMDEGSSCVMGIEFNCSTFWGEWTCDTVNRSGSAYVNCSVAEGQSSKTFALHSSHNGAEILNLASAIESRGIACKVRRVFEESEADDLTETWGLSVSDESREEAQEIFKSGDVSKDPARVESRWRDSVLRFGHSVNEVCRSEIEDP